MMLSLRPLSTLLPSLLLVFVNTVKGQSCDPSCQPPRCSCPRLQHPMDIEQIPQMVYFAFDGAVDSAAADVYDKLFTYKRVNPNNCTMKMTLFVPDDNTDYELVKKYYARGMEIGTHSVTHDLVTDPTQLRRNAKLQRKNFVKYAGIPKKGIKGWRSPFLATAGESQPEVLKSCKYQYDISLTYGRFFFDDPKPWPFTMDNGWPYVCPIPPCPTNESVADFWTVPVNYMLHHRTFSPCIFADWCLEGPVNPEETFDFLFRNFKDYYEGNRAPFGIHVHPAWFASEERLQETMRFLDEMAKHDDVYVLTVQQVLDWMRHPTPLSDIHTLSSWGCSES